MNLMSNRADCGPTYFAVRSRAGFSNLDSFSSIWLWKVSMAIPARSVNESKIADSWMIAGMFIFLLFLLKYCFWKHCSRQCVCWNTLVLVPSDVNRMLLFSLDCPINFVARRKSRIRAETFSVHEILCVQLWLILVNLELC